MALHLSNSSLCQASIRASSIGRTAGHESVYSRFKIIFFITAPLQCVDVYGGFIHAVYGYFMVINVAKRVQVSESERSRNSSVIEQSEKKGKMVVNQGAPD
jgi:hypothetical protein